MGGSNSGRWFYHDKRATANACPYISAGSLPKLGRTVGNSIMVVERASEYSAVVTYHDWSEFVREVACNILKVPYTAPNEPLPPIYQKVIRLSLSPRHMGGGQAYYVCPVCQHRALKLYWRYQRFACRTCQDLTYESCQRSHEFDRGSGWLGVLNRATLADQLSIKAAELQARYMRCRGDSKASRRLFVRMVRLWQRCEMIDAGLSLFL